MVTRTRELFSKSLCLNVSFRAKNNDQICTKESAAPFSDNVQNNNLESATVKKPMKKDLRPPSDNRNKTSIPGGEIVPPNNGIGNFNKTNEKNDINQKEKQGESNK